MCIPLQKLGCVVAGGSPIAGVHRRKPRALVSSWIARLCGPGTLVQSFPGNLRHPTVPRAVRGRGTGWLPIALPLFVPSAQTWICTPSPIPRILDPYQPDAWLGALHFDDRLTENIPYASLPYRYPSFAHAANDANLCYLSTLRRSGKATDSLATNSWGDVGRGEQWRRALGLQTPGSSEESASNRCIRSVHGSIGRSRSFIAVPDPHDSSVLAHWIRCFSRGVNALLSAGHRRAGPSQVCWSLLTLSTPRVIDQLVFSLLPVRFLFEQEVLDVNT